MLKLNRLELINWHYMSGPEILSFSSSFTFLTGANASGKTTIIDALQTVLFVKTDGYNLSNNVSTARHGRNIVGYVRADIDLNENDGSSMNKQKYKREKATTTHLAAEITYPDGKVAYTVGFTASFDSDSTLTKDLKKTWWYAECPLEDIPFLSSEKKVNRLDIIKKAGLPGFREYQTQENAKKDLSYKYGLTDSVDGNTEAFDKWTKVLSSCIAFNPKEMRDVNGFLKELVFEDNTIKIDGLKEFLEKMIESRMDLEEARKKTDRLEKIHEEADRYRAASKSADIADIIKNIANADICSASENTKRSELNILNAEVERLLKNKENLQKNLDSVNRQYIIIENKSKDAALDSDIAFAKKDVDESKTALLEAKKTACKVNDLVSKAGLIGCNELTGDTFTEKVSSPEWRPTAEDISLVSSFFDKAAEMKDHLMHERYTLSERTNSLTDKQNTLSAEANKLRMNKATAENSSQEALLMMLKKELQYTGRTDEVMFLYEKLSCNDRNWQPAIEAFLGYDRFDIWVPEDLFYDATTAYDKYRKEHPGFYGAAIIDARGLLSSSRQVQVNDKSICHVLESKDPNVTAYIEYAYGNILMCDNAKDVPPDSRQVYIDINLMKHSRRKYMPMRKVVCVIGSEAKKERLKSIEKEHVQISREIDEAKSYSSKISSIINVIDSLPRNSELENSLYLASELKTRENMYAELVDRMNRLLSEDDKQLLTELEHEKESIFTEIKKLDSEELKKNKKIGALEKELQDLKEQIENASAIIRGIADSEYYKEASDVYQENLKENHANASDIKARYSEKAAKSYKEKDSINEKISSLQDEYIEIYSSRFSNIPSGGFESIGYYEEQLEKIKNEKIVELEKKYKESTERVEDIMKKNIISSLSSSFITSARIINILNNIMSKVYYNGRTYLISMKPASGKEELHRAIRRCRADGKDLSVIDHPEEHEEDKSLDALVSMMVSEIMKIHSEKDMDEFFNYKSYITFNVDVKDETKTKESSFTNLIATGSGSEVQIPSYIILSAALLNAYGVKRYNKGMEKDSLRFMIIDEAFDKMDEVNVKKLISTITKDMELQLLAAAPTDRFEKMGDSIGTVIIMKTDKSRKQRTAFVLTYEEALEQLPKFT